LAGDERRASGRAALLAVPVGEAGALAGDAVDVRRLVPHDAAVVATRVEPANVVAPDDEDVRLLAILLLRGPGDGRGDIAAHKIRIAARRRVAALGGLFAGS